MYPEEILRVVISFRGAHSGPNPDIFEPWFAFPPFPIQLVLPRFSFNPFFLCCCFQMIHPKSVLPDRTPLHQCLLCLEHWKSMFFYPHYVPLRQTLKAELNNDPDICAAVDWAHRWWIFWQYDKVVDWFVKLCCLCIKPLSVLITLKAFTLADYSKTDGLDLVMVRFPVPQCRELISQSDPLPDTARMHLSQRQQLVSLKLRVSFACYQFNIFKLSCSCWLEPSHG